MSIVNRLAVSAVLIASAAAAQHQGLPTPVTINLGTQAFQPGHPAYNYPGGAAATNDGLPGGTMSPDGRLFLFAWRNGCAAESGWYVSVLRHESVGLNSSGVPQFTPPVGPTSWSPAVQVETASRTSPYAPTRALSTTGPNPHPMWILQWVTMFPDPSFSNLPCPYTSDVNGNPVAPGVSPSFVTYRMTLVAADDYKVDAVPATNLANPQFRYTTSCNNTNEIQTGYSTREVQPIGQRTLTVIVANPYTPQAAVQSLSINSTLDQLWFDPDVPQSQERPILGIEPTVTADGRFLVFQSSPNVTGANWSTTPAQIDRLMYSINSTPGATHHWSQPRSIAELNTHANDLINGVRLADRYPLAAQPLVEMDGTPFTAANGTSNLGVAGAYPWLTLDGTDLTFSSINSTTTGRVHGVCMIGRSTHWRMRHLDGPINPSRRGNTTDGQANPSDAYSRRMMTGTGLATGPWKWGRGGSTVLPYSPALRTFSMFSSRAQEYCEVAVDAGLDPDILLALDMNEAIRGNGTVQADWSIDLGATPDTAGSGVVASLTGDASFDLPTSQTAPVQDPVLYTGRIGECVTFVNTGSVLVPSIAALNQPQNSETISFWAKTANSTAQAMRSVIQKGTAFSVTLDGSGNVQYSVRETSGIKTISPVIATAAASQWTHFAIVFDGAMGTASLWVDGNSVNTLTLVGSVPHQLEGNATNVLIGPNGVGTTDTSPKLFVDQLRIDRTVRDRTELARLAFVAPTSNPSSPLPTWFANSLIANGRSPNGLSLPVGSVLTTNTINLGEMLFKDPQLSPLGVSCATCHTQPLDFTDGIAQRLGATKTIKLRNAQSVIDRLWGTAQFWDGRAPGLEEQVSFPLKSPDEMASSDSFVMSRITSSSSGYPALFAAAYGLAPSVALMQSAIASYERALISLPSRADQYESGSSGVLTSLEIQGRNLFFGKARCFACHSGTNRTDEQFHVTLVNDTTDLGHGAQTNRLRENFRFKTPSLRHLQNTAPYFHRGSATSLTDVIASYVRGGDNPVARDEEIFPLDLNGPEQAALQAYLGALESTWTKL